jgi:hypothetical protein
MTHRAERGNAGPSTRGLNSITAQLRRGEFGALAQDDILPDRGTGSGSAQRSHLLDPG